MVKVVTGKKSVVLPKLPFNFAESVALITSQVFHGLANNPHVK